MKPGRLNLLEPSGPVMGFFTFTFIGHEAPERWRIGMQLLSL
jgi:hypothetical protein